MSPLTNEVWTGDRSGQRHGVRKTTDDTTREQMILDHMGLVHALARRYAERGEQLDDLVQVGMVGLIKAVDRFDPSRGIALTSFATPTILGEIRRHFRDRTWMLHVPRGLKERHSRVSHAIEGLTTALGRTPSVHEVGEMADLSEEEVLDALQVRDAYRPASLSVPDRDDGSDPAHDVGALDDGFDWAEGRVAVGDRVKALPARERALLHMRFEQDMSQSEIAEVLGISQMHVSRLLAKALADLRAQIEGPPERAGET